ncbi:sensor histidine kinase [Sphingomonas prati]|uniref:histidine kinase n=1 Tax=Sphingomonas prati TaxID=1843237 RepID=A0A7W9F3J6_9SPHN|nr:HAMP domain-containing sensor histidine kinase [Sphingomonas prati]MBB5729590.1 signal transduction histidine kinase [Sphingomonas prati]
MRVVPRSLVGRLLAISTVVTLAALLFAGFAIGGVLERFVMTGFDQRLDAQLSVLTRAVRADGTLDTGRVVDLPPFGEAGSGWFWRIDGPGGVVRASGVADGVVPTARLRGPGPGPGGPGDRDGTWPGDVRTAGGALHYRQVALATGRGMVTVTAGGPRAVVTQPLRAAMTPLLLSLGLLGLALATATIVQVRVGLRPLRGLAVALADVRAGRRQQVPDDQPTELTPVVAELNALIVQNAAGLDHARRHVANLAHGLKTPLAALGVRLAEPGRDPDGTLGEMVARIDAQVRHHLGRARAVAPGAAQRLRTELAPAVGDLVAVLERVHAERALAVSVLVGADVAVAVDGQDLSEMIGNLLDNGWRHAAGRLEVTAERAGAMVRIAIEDDGPGLSGAAAEEAMVPGRRLDERGDGHGFGLPITRELAELYGGSLLLERGVLGGVRAVLVLPAPVGG